EAAFRRTRHRDRSAAAAIPGSAARVSEGRSRPLVADHQGVEHQGGVGTDLSTSLRGANATKQSSFLVAAKEAGLRCGACHRARGRATRWLAMTASGNLLQFLQTPFHPYLRGHLGVRKTRLPVGDADFADIDVALGIHRDAVRREEFAGLEPWAL